MTVFVLFWLVHSFQLPDFIKHFNLNAVLIWTQNESWERKNFENRKLNSQFLHNQTKRAMKKIRHINTLNVHQIPNYSTKYWISEKKKKKTSGLILYTVFIDEQNKTHRTPLFSIGAMPKLIKRANWKQFLGRFHSFHAEYNSYRNYHSNRTCQLRGWTLNDA